MINRVMKAIIILSLIALFISPSCSNKLKGTKWIGTENKYEIEALRTKINTIAQVNMSYEEFVKKMRVDTILQDTYLYLGLKEQNLTSFEEFKKKLGFGKQPMIDFITDKKVCISTMKEDGSASVMYFNYNFNEPIIDIYMMSNGKSFPAYTGQLREDDTMMLSDTHGNIYAIFKQGSYYSINGRKAFIYNDKQTEFMKKYPNAKKE